MLIEGAKRLSFMMLDRNVAAVSPSSVWRVLQKAGLSSKWTVSDGQEAHRTAFINRSGRHEQCLNGRTICRTMDLPLSFHPSGGSMVVFNNVHFSINDKGFMVFPLTFSHSIVVLRSKLIS